MRHTVLVIDDQWSMQELARIVLQTAGYRVLLASDTVTGLCLARMEHPDVTVLDVKMANDDGRDLVNGLRHDPTTANIPLILISPFDQEACLSQADDETCCLHKPFHPPELLIKVDAMLHREAMPIAV